MIEEKFRMRCKVCRRKIPKSKDALFCTYCGSKINSAIKTEPAFEEAVGAMHQVMTGITEEVMNAIKTIKRAMLLMLIRPDEMFSEEWQCEYCGTTLPKEFMYCWRCLQFGSVSLNPTLEKPIETHERRIGRMLTSAANKLEEAIGTVEQARRRELKGS
jgi:hypothetical protein